MTADAQFVTSGIGDLDELLGGGFQPNRMYLVEGNPGSGKTTLGLQYLLEGARLGQKSLYVTLSETRDELIAVGRSHGWDLDGIDIFELSPDEAALDPDSQYAMFQPSEIELGVTTKAILEEVRRLDPQRVVFDSLSEMRLLAQSALRYRRQVLALKQFFIRRNSTVLLLDDLTSEVGDLQLESLAHGVVVLDQLAPIYGTERRRLRVVKMRGARFRGGFHDFTIERGGLSIYPRLVAADHQESRTGEAIGSGLGSIDTLLGGGIERGASVLVVGPAGVGKSSLSALYAHTAAQRGERTAAFIFDESRATFLTRTRGLGLDIERYLKTSLITLDQVDPAEMSPGEFAHRICKAVAGADGGSPARIVIIDSLNGYLNAMPEENFLAMQLHELLTYLGKHGVVTFLVLAQHGIFGSIVETPVDTSYLADCVILLRYFEAEGAIRKAISVVKKRTGPHERTIREFSLRGGRIGVGEPLTQFRGVLGGIPRYDASPVGLEQKGQRP